MTDLQDDGVFCRTPPGSTDHTFDADLQYCAFTVSNRWLRIVRIADKRDLMEFDAPLSGYYTLRFSPDGRFLAARLEDGLLLVWDLNARAMVLKTLPKSNTNTRAALDFTPDSRMVAVGDVDGAIRRFELPSGNEAPALPIGVRLMSSVALDYLRGWKAQ